ncbi:hypothetical protein EM595_p1001 (plasmid) [Duffyella gerundensis]|uniref:Uncharacterized protein n=1 Tax=Duffyella gerundensis TaxID=1619313 RepID=A0A0U5L607_9GAMM|nr:hypothetical protein EM595_p1001 [Duffyella gerundensis]
MIFKMSHLQLRTQKLIYQRSRHTLQLMLHLLSLLNSLKTTDQVLLSGK